MMRAVTLCRAGLLEVLAVVCLAAMPQATGVPGFSITISAPESTINAGADLIVNVVFTNTSGRRINLNLDQADYRLEVHDEYGDPVRLTDYGRTLPAAGTGFVTTAKDTGFLTVPLQPGETARAQIDASKVFNLTWTGKYAISLRGYDPENRAQVQSNMIEVRVVQLQCPQVAASPLAESATRHPDLSATLSTKRHAVEVGSPIEVEESLTNPSRHAVGIPPYAPDIPREHIYETRFGLRDSGGCPVGRRTDLHPPGGSFWSNPPLKPGETRKNNSLVSNSFDFSRPGIYTMQEILSNVETHEEIASKVLTVTVFEGCTDYGVIYSNGIYFVNTKTRTPGGLAKPGQLDECTANDYNKKGCAPVLIYRIEPKYTEEARQAELSGTVVLGLTVDQTGKTADVRVLESLDKGLDEQAVAAVKQWKYKPALYKGYPFAVSGKLNLEFGCIRAKFPIGYR